MVTDLMRETSMTEADVLRRLIVLGLKWMKDPADLLKIPKEV
jgi:hypothetical protein